jgi:hypothetical protein
LLVEPCSNEPLTGFDADEIVHHTPSHPLYPITMSFPVTFAFAVNCPYELTV